MIPTLNQEQFMQVVDKYNKINIWLEKLREPIKIPYIPLELIHESLSYLSVTELNTASLVCKAWQAEANKIKQHKKILLKTKSVDKAIDYIIEHQLTHVDLSNFEAFLADNHLKKLAEKQPDLQYITFGESYNKETDAGKMCSRVTDEGLMRLAENCSKLKEINVNGCFCVTDSGLMFLAGKCLDLKKIHFDINSLLHGTISLKWLKALLESRPDLHFQVLICWVRTYCPSIINELMHFAEQHPNNIHIQIQPFEGDCLGFKDLQKNYPNVPMHYLEQKPMALEMDLFTRVALISLAGLVSFGVGFVTAQK